MTPSRALLLAVVLVTFSVPWFFGPDSQSAVLGVPWWVVYSLGATGVAACLLAVGLRWWDRLADDAQRVHQNVEDL